MSRRIWNRIRQEFGLWLQAAPPGIVVLFMAILIRITGGMQSWEWMLFDRMLCLRPVEKLDERVVIVGIDEKDIEWVRQYPIPDEKIAELLTKLETYKPLAIGLDIFKNVPVEPGGKQLAQVLQQNTNIIGIQKILPPEATSPPHNLPPERVGFVDLPNDRDSKNRRYLLFTTNPQNPDNINEDKYSLALRLVIKYFQAKGIELETGKNDANTIRFRGIELPRITQNFGGYVGVNDGGLSILMNFRNTYKPFHVIATASVVRTLSAGHTPSHHVDNQTGQVACESDF